MTVTRRSPPTRAGWCVPSPISPRGLGPQPIEIRKQPALSVQPAGLTPDHEKLCTPKTVTLELTSGLVLPPRRGLLRQRLALRLRGEPDRDKADDIDQAQPRAGLRVLPVELLFDEVADI